MVTYKVHLLRHGLTSGNREGRYIGRTDLPLCQEGREQLERLKREYEYPKADMVVSSPLRRCVQTADILYPDAYTETWPEFTEYDFGEFEGKSVEELKGVYRFQEWIEGGMAQAPPGGETHEQLTRRAAQGMNRLMQRMMQDRLYSVALVTHGGLINLLLYGMGLPKRDIVHCSARNGCGFTVLMTPQMWMRDRAFEIYGVAPYGMTEAEAMGGKRREW